MICARNYAAHVQEAMRDWAVHPADKASVEALSECLDASVHFTLPDNGRILDDQLKGLDMARLPFKQVTLEYFVPSPKLDAAHPSDVRKRLIYAGELLPRELSGLLRFALSDCDYAKLMQRGEEVFIWVVAFMGVGEGWYPIPLAFMMPTTSWSDVTQLFVQGKTDELDAAFIGVPIPLFQNTFGDYFDRIADDKPRKQDLCNDISSEARVVLEFCEALSCSNVSHVSVQTVRPSVNVKRKRAGKLPLHEVRALVVRVPKRAARADREEDDGPTRASPRQHLRCGHVRTYQSGEKIFIQSCTVGARERGRIDKNYVLIGA